MDFSNVFSSYKEKVEIQKKLGEFFHAELYKNEDILNYCINIRRFTEEDIKTFQIGYNPNSVILSTFLNENNINYEELTFLGFLTKNEDDSFYDKFSDRLIFPIFDTFGGITGFSGRVWREGDSRAKYILNNNSSIFQKSLNLYGLYQNLEYIVKHKTVLVVEGNTDVISCRRAGIPIGVCAFGTSFMEEHLKVLMLYADTFLFCQDDDDAGKKSTEKIQKLLSSYKDIKVGYLKLSGAKDPDDFIKLYGGDSLKKGVIDLRNSLFESSV